MTQQRSLSKNWIKEHNVDPSWEDDLKQNPCYVEYRNMWQKTQDEYVLHDLPLYIEVESSYACNYKCIACPRHFVDKSIRPHGELSDELFDKLFLEAKEKGLTSINLSHGGEPLLRKNFEELVWKAREANIPDIMFHTNGSLLTKERSKKIIANGLTKINISLDAASKETYAKVRPGGDYEQVLQNIMEFVELKKAFGASFPRVRVSFIAMPENQHECEAFLEFWKDKVNVVAFQEYRDFSVLQNESKNNVDIHKSHSCCKLWNAFMISSDGSMMPCAMNYNHDIVVGNLRENSIEEGWKSEKMRGLRRLHKENKWYTIPLCKKCISMYE